MMNKKIKESFDTILPTEEQKRKMFDNVTQKNEKKHFSFYYLVAPCLAVFCMIYFLPAQTNPEVTPSPRVTSFRTIEYQGVCYENIGVHDGKYLKYINKTNSGEMVYQMKNQKDQIVILENSEYQLYEKCRGEIK